MEIAPILRTHLTTRGQRKVQGLMRSPAGCLRKSSMLEKALELPKKLDKFRRPVGWTGRHNKLRRLRGFSQQRLQKHHPSPNNHPTPSTHQTQQQPTTLHTQPSPSHNPPHQSLCENPTRGAPHRAISQRFQTSERVSHPALCPTGPQSSARTDSRSYPVRRRSVST